MSMKHHQFPKPMESLFIFMDSDGNSTYGNPMEILGSTSKTYGNKMDVKCPKKHHQFRKKHMETLFIFMDSYGNLTYGNPMEI